jgi:hypothetical protein
VATVLRLRTPEDRRFDTYLKTSKQCAKTVLEQESENRAEKESERLKDVLSVLGEYSSLQFHSWISQAVDSVSNKKKVQSNNEEDPKKRLDDDEVLSQISYVFYRQSSITAVLCSFNHSFISSMISILQS